MKKQVTGLRLGVLLLFIIGLMSPIASAGVGAQDLTCDDFTSTRAAQAVLDADPSLEDALDPDGDGIACNEDESSTDATEEATQDTDNGSSDDADAYLADIQDEVDSLQESADRFLEIDALGADATPDDVDELNQIAADWIDYPDVAAQFEAPTGLEDVQDAYLGIADTFSEAGQLWEEYWAIPAENDDEEKVALDAFNEVFIDGQNQIADINDLIAEAGGSGTKTDDNTPAATDDEYLSAVQDELTSLDESVTRFNEIYDLGSDATADDIDEINQIASDWSDYPDVAAELVAPDEFADVEDAYLNLADTFAEAGDAWAEYWALPSGDADEEDVLATFQDTLASAQDQITEVQDLIDEAGGSSTNNRGGDDETPVADGDTQAYLDEVSTNADDWNASIARFTEIIALGADATDQDTAEVGDILDTWASAPDVAAELEAPAGLEDVQAAYEDYADELAAASAAFQEWLGTEADSPEETAAFDDFIAAIGNASDLYTELQDQIEAAG